MVALEVAHVGEPGVVLSHSMVAAELAGEVITDEGSSDIRRSATPVIVEGEGAFLATVKALPPGKGLIAPLAVTWVSKEGGPVWKSHLARVKIPSWHLTS